jgi:hypothetical protein
MTKFLEVLKQLVRTEPRRTRRARPRQRRRDPDFVGGSSIKDIEQAPPGRAQELAGHAVERVET